MASFWRRLKGGRVNAPEEQKSISPQSLFAMIGGSDASWSDRSTVSLTNQGYARNPIVYRCVRMLAEAAMSVPFTARENGKILNEHPALDLLKRPNPRQSGVALFETVYSFLHTAGNAYLEAVIVDDKVKGLYALRPDRMKLVAGKDGWPLAYDYSAGGRTTRLSQKLSPIPKVLHLKQFHPLDDHYGLAPLHAAQFSLDTHNAAVKWNKALLDNAARPSGALVYSGSSGNLTKSQFERLKEELEIGFQGANNAGRPMVLEGGLDWKSMALSPRDMDFLEAKNAAAREIALAFGVPPMLLGIPGDNTYSNYAEANRVFWRQSVVPMVKRVGDSIGKWLEPAFQNGFELVPQLENIDALAEDTNSLWQRVGTAEFLSDEEKREILGLATTTTTGACQSE